MTTSPASSGKTSAKEWSINSLLTLLAFELGRATGMLHGRLAVASNPNLLNNDDLTIAATSFSYVVTVNAGYEGTPTYVTAKLDFMTMSIGVASVIITTNDSEVATSVTTWLTGRYPQANYIVQIGNAVRFEWSEALRPEPRTSI
jgi:hypothetical protein